MTVLFVDPAPGLGGAERSLLLLLDHLDRRWQPHVVSPGGPLADRAAARGIPVHRVPLPRLRRAGGVATLWRGARAVAEVARRTGARLIHANTVRAAWYSAAAARLSGVPWLWHMRDFWLSERRPASPVLDGALRRLLAGSAWRVVANSRAVATHLPPGATIIHNGIEVAAFDPTAQSPGFRRTWGLPADAPLVGMVGRLRPWKGQDRFLRVAARVREQVPESRFVVVGGNPFGPTDGADDYTNSLRALSTLPQLRDAAIFTGQLEDVRPALATMDLFVHPGEPEPFGLVTVEAMAMARPIVAFAHGAMPELIDDGRSGRLVPPNDESALASAVIALLRDPAARQRLGRQARLRAARHFDIQRTVAEVEALYGQLG